MFEDRSITNTAISEGQGREHRLGMLKTLTTRETETAKSGTSWSHEKVHEFGRKGLGLMRHAQILTATRRYAEISYWKLQVEKTIVLAEVGTVGFLIRKLIVDAL